MTFLDKELSLDQGYPIELYEFAIGSTTFRYTNSNETITLGLNTYNPVPIERTSIEQKTDAGRLPIELTSIKSLDVISKWKEDPFVVTVALTIKRLHLSDGATPETFVIWQGRVLDVEFTSKNSKIRCEPIYTSLKRPGLRRKYQVQCPHVLYGPICKADINLHFVTADVDTVSGLTLTYKNDSNDAGGNPMPTGQLIGGYVEWATDGVIQRRGIVDHFGKTITLKLPSSDLVPDLEIKLYRGCAHNTFDCATKFANIDNYGGFPYSPSGRNPFQTHSPVF